MANEVYSLQSLRECIKGLVKMLDISYPTGDLHVGVIEGGWTNDQPWLIKVSVHGELASRFDLNGHIESIIKPQTFLDQVDHGGLVDIGAYTAGLFDNIMGRLLDCARDPAQEMHFVRDNLGKYSQEHGFGLNPNDWNPLGEGNA